ncbi:hypothetical protein MP638_002458 [Amoeboaphelidium occidentale]|nr:hypothetical protein MP638_002458 [Amoeboaphelidium occidentale]
MDNFIQYARYSFSLYITYCIVTPVTILVNIILLPVNFSLWLINWYINVVTYIAQFILRPRKSLRLLMKRVGWKNKGGSQYGDYSYLDSTPLHQDHDAGTVPSYMDGNTTITNLDHEAKKTYEWMQGYLIMVDTYDPNDPPSFKPSLIPKLLKKGKAPKSNESVASRKKRIQRENLYYGCFVVREGILKLYSASDAESLSSSNPLIPGDSSLKPLREIYLKDFTISIHPKQVQNYRYFSRVQPLKVASNVEQNLVFYLFMPTNIEKEVWYITLKKLSSGLSAGTSVEYELFQKLIKTILMQQDQASPIEAKTTTSPTRTETPSRRRLFRLRPRNDQKSAAMKELPSLPTSDHSQLSDFCTIWLNFILARMWMSAKSSEKLHILLETRILKQMGKIKRPAFLGEIALRRLFVGDTCPLFDKISILSYSPYGDVKIATDFKYEGKFTLELETEAKFDVGGRKAAINLNLSVCIQEITGRLILKTNPFPSSRLWWAFETMPKMTISVVPLVGDTNIGFNMVKESIETKLQEAIADSIVLPNMEDFPLFGDQNLEIWKGFSSTPKSHITSPSTSSIASSKRQLGTSSADSSDLESLKDSEGGSVHNMTPVPESPAEDHHSFKPLNFTSDDINGIIAAAAQTIPSLNLSPSIARRSSFSPPTTLKHGPDSPGQKTGFSPLFIPSLKTVSAQGTVRSPTSPVSASNFRDGMLNRVNSAKQKWFKKKDGSQESL